MCILRCLLGRRVGIQPVLLLLFILLNQVRIDLKVLDVKIGMEKFDLLFAQVEALVEVRGSCFYHNLLVF